LLKFGLNDKKSYEVITQTTGIKLKTIRKYKTIKKIKKSTKKTNQLSNNSTKEYINVPVRSEINKQTYNLDLAEKFGMEKEKLDELYNEEEKKQRNRGVPEDLLEKRVNGRVNIELKKLFFPTNKIDPAGIKDYEEYCNSEPKEPSNEIFVYPDIEKPNYSKHDLFEWKSNVYYKFNFIKPMKFLVINYQQKKTSTAEFRCKKEAEDQYSCDITKMETHGNIAFKNVKEYIPIFKDVPRQYRFECIDSYNNEIVYTGTYNDITAEIDADGYTYNERKIKEILKLAKALLQKKGNYQTSKLSPYLGFFWIDGTLQTNLELKETLNKKKLKEALELLENFASFFEENKKKLGYILHWMIMAPYNFAMKQSGNGDPLGSLYVVGNPGSGKTTCASLNMYISNTS